MRALASGGRAGETLTLTGPELLSMPDMVRVVGQVLGRGLEMVDVPLDVYRERLLAAGVALVTARREARTRDRLIA
ncbi:hypothetical protein [Nonomuraea rubra]|uniref:Uncharacterized protein YbjT (DUF2867 family) n=1 Tax=Nonomuraea rubra TaxID=46180 RepID=A0A7X0P540_9ACTN|nr:hypothetical protein [Nonomuraea rubra]MBB6555261.1 uncharacterized protein YbjT (DUF2867 family) [Nonomuraea rubra]